MNAICIVVEDEKDSLQALRLAEDLGILILDSVAAESYPYQLRFTSQGLELLFKHEQGRSRVFVDFLKGKIGYRRVHGGGYQQAIAKAVGIKGPSPQQSLSVLDATAGLGKDAFLLACLGCRLHLVERSPIIAALLQDGLRRALEDPTLNNLLKDKIKVSLGDAIAILRAMDRGDGPGNSEDEDRADNKERPDVIYLDPMFPEENKTALTTIDLRIIRDIVGKDLDSEELFQVALKVAKQRVVVKRSIQAPTISSLKPSYSLLGKRNRYDVYIQLHLRD